MSYYLLKSIKSRDFFLNILKINSDKDLHDSPYSFWKGYVTVLEYLLFIFVLKIIVSDLSLRPNNEG